MVVLMVARPLSVVVVVMVSGSQALEHRLGSGSGSQPLERRFGSGSGSQALERPLGSGSDSGSQALERR